MIIEQGIREYLIDVTNGDTSQPARQTARSAVLAAIGNRIYLSRRPQSELDPALTITSVSELAFNDIGGEPDCSTTLINLTVWGKQGGTSPIVLAELGKEHLRQAVAQYRGLMGTVTVYSVAMERANIPAPVSPPDMSDNWTFAHSTDYLFIHSQAAAIAAT